MALVASLGLALAAAAGAAEVKAHPKEMKFTGEITSVNVPAKQFTVRSDEKGKAGEMTFHVSRPTSIRIDGEFTPLARLEKGEHVTVTYELNGSSPLATQLHRHTKHAT
jgi:hypothetical protein